VQRAYEALLLAVTSAQAAMNGQTAGADGEDGNDEDTPGLHSEPVRQALRLLGHFQPSEQLIAFQDMMAGSRPVAFPTALRDVMGYTFVYRWGWRLLGTVVWMGCSFRLSVMADAADNDLIGCDSYSF
jgi:hypothetical protein